MKSIIRQLFILLVLVSSGKSYLIAQERYKITYDSISCEPSFINEYSKILPRVRKATPLGKTESSDFIVHYEGFSVEARESFAYAVSLWDALIDSPVPIHIEAKWIALGTNTLGSAIWGNVERDIEGGQPNTVYPISLAEKIEGKPINATGSPDIKANFNSEFDWYYGLDAVTPSGKIDLVSVVLHEIGHGLGISDSFSNSGQRGFFGFNDEPIIYDQYVINGNNELLIETYENNTLILHIQIMNSLFFNSPIAKKINAGSPPKLYTPKPFNGGSSIAHLDEQTYGAGNENSLMSPQIGFAEGIHDPGPLIMAMLAEMGWVHTYFHHTPVLSIEDLNTAALVSSIIESDTDLQQDKLMLHYSSDGFSNEDISVLLSSDGNSYSATIPATGTAQDISYYLEAVDKHDRVYNEPHEGYHNFSFAPDNTPPSIEMDEPQFLYAFEDSIQLVAEVADPYGLESVELKYQIKDGGFVTVEMDQDDDNNNIYKSTIHIKGLGLVDGDDIQYTIIATDASSGSNVATLPLEGENILPIKDYREAVPSYTNTFDEPTDDFVGWRFSITQPANFQSPAIHSDHPYENGMDDNNESNYTFLLLNPIIVRDIDAFIDYDEIVLVEPGDPGQPFGGPSFFDYVVVEGSKDFGETWKLLEIGYDSGDDGSWLDVYNESFTGFNSDGIGTPALYKHRQKNILAGFSEGDEILIRFRLFADQAAHGWGWAIDNLAIQDEIVSIKDGILSDIQTYPNPVKDGRMTIDFGSDLQENINLSITSMLGLEIENRELIINNRKMDIDVNNLPSGYYLLNIKSANSVYISKIFISK